MNANWFDKDFYSVLGVAENASAEEIKRAYRKLAQSSHPDRHPGDKPAEERFKAVSEANDVLSDPKKRAEYDQARRMARGRFHAGPGQPPYDADDFGFDLGDVFGSVFRSASRTRRGHDLRTDVHLSFEDAINGTTIAVATGDGEVKVRIPPGVDDGARIRVGGRGEPASNGAVAGDLYVDVHVAKHATFGREGTDLTVDMHLSFVDAALGTQATVPTLDGPVTLKIPPGTQPGRTFRVKGRGVPKPKGGRGDLLATARVEVPKNLSDEERRLLEELRSAQRKRVRS